TFPTRRSSDLGGAEPALGACVAGSAAAVGAHIGRGGGPDWAGETGPGWLGCTACDGGVGAGAGAGAGGREAGWAGGPGGGAAAVGATASGCGGGGMVGGVAATAAGTGAGGWGDAPDIASGQFGIAWAG